MSESIDTAGISLPNGWSQKRLIDCTSDGLISYGIVQPGKHQENGVPVIRVNNFGTNGLELADVIKVAPDVESKYKRTRLVGGEVLLTLVGSTGRSVIAPPELAGWNVPRAIAVIRASDDIGAEWINICLQSVVVKQFLDERANTTVQKTLNLKDVKEVPIPLPPPEVKKGIESIAISLERKVSLNRQVNQTLEQIAQAIFKSWFVDFEPVKAKRHVRALGGNDEQTERAAQAFIAGAVNLDVITTATSLSALDDQLVESLSEKLAHETDAQREQLATTASHFPDQLVESELGLIPEGWEASSFGQVVEILDSKRVPLSKREREEHKGPYPYYGAAALMDHVDDFLFEGPHVLMAEDGSVIDGDGYPITQYVWGQFWVNNHAHVLKGANGVCDEQILLFLKSTTISQYVTGAVQLKVNQKNMKSMPFVKATDAVDDDFCQLIKPLYRDIRSRFDECGALSRTRDILLPKLLSGDLPAVG